MTPTQALSAVALLGGMNATARMILNAHGKPIARPNLSKAINQNCGVPDWLAQQLYNLVCRHGESCEALACELDDEIRVYLNRSRETENGI
jgi:hypothetical protein